MEDLAARLLPVSSWSLVRNYSEKGCLSHLRLFPGPCSIDMKNESTDGIVFNPHSWNSEANIFFLDQPYVVTPSFSSDPQR